MSENKFKLGDRVVITADDFRGDHGEVVEFSAMGSNPLVKLDMEDHSLFFRPDEIELESVYEALSYAPEVDTGGEDAVSHPSHYNSHPSGIEAIEVTEHMTFNAGNAVKYLWRAGLKSPDAIQDLQKASWYISREIERLGGSVG
jgi:hypothetical protein